MSKPLPCCLPSVLGSHPASNLFHLGRHNRGVWMAHYLNVASTTSTAGPEPSSRAMRHTPHESGKVRNQFHLCLGGFALFLKLLSRCFHLLMEAQAQARLAALYVDPLFALYRIDVGSTFVLAAESTIVCRSTFHAGCSPNVMTLGVGWTRDRHRAASRRTRRVCAPSDPESTPAFWALVVRMLVYCQSVSHNSRQDTRTGHLLRKSSSSEISAGTLACKSNSV